MKLRNLAIGVTALACSILPGCGNRAAKTAAKMAKCYDELSFCEVLANQTSRACMPERTLQICGDTFESCMKKPDAPAAPIFSITRRHHN